MYNEAAWRIFEATSGCDHPSKVGLGTKNVYFVASQVGFFCTQIVLVMLHQRLNKTDLCVISGSQYKLLFILYLHILFKISLNILAPLKLKWY